MDEQQFQVSVRWGAYRHDTGLLTLRNAIAYASMLEDGKLEAIYRRCMHVRKFYAGEKTDARINALAGHVASASMTTNNPLFDGLLYSLAQTIASSILHADSIASMQRNPIAHDGYPARDSNGALSYHLDARIHII